MGTAVAQSMFERYGGFAKVSRVVSAFYGKVLESADLAPFFENTDMRVQIDHQTKFIASLMGGPASYSDAELQRIHARLNISDRDFREIVELLTETLEDFDFEPADIDAVREEMTRRKPLIVMRGAA